MSGPPPAVAATRHAVRTWIADARARGLLGSGSAITVASSGGADSMALCAAAVFEGLRVGHPIWGVTVDHRLQPGSAQQAEVVASLMRGLGCARVEIRAVDVRADGGPEGAARSARYGALAEFAAEGGWVLLGHTLDDQAESVLLGLGRGSGAKSLAGMQEYNAPWGRPFLGVRRTDTIAACDQLGLPIWNDPHNRDPRFRRVRLRHEVLPLLEQVLGGGVAPALARTADLLRADAEALDQLAADTLGRLMPETTAADAYPALRTEDLHALARAVRTRVVKLWLERSGVAALTAAHLEAVDALVTAWRGQGPAFLPRGFSVTRRHAILILTRS